MYAAGKHYTLDASPTWIVDPIDGNLIFVYWSSWVGTTNFVHGIPDMSISIGFTLDKHPAVGVVLNPFTGHLYTAIRGSGARRSVLSADLSSTLSTSPLPLFSGRPLRLSESVISSSIGADRGNNLEIKTKTWRNLLSRDGGIIRGLRVFQSTALELCAVASGSMDGFWMGGGWEWDICAGWVIVTEAGGMIVDGNARSETSALGEMNEPDLCRQLLLAVRRGDRNEQQDWIRQFWSLIDGKLKYNR